MSKITHTFSAAIADDPQAQADGEVLPSHWNADHTINATELTAALNVFGPDTGSGGVKGLAPATAAGDATKFLRGDGTWVTISGGGDALTSNPLSQFAATTSLQLKGVISDETGSGALMFATSPVVTTDITIPNTGLHLLDTNASHDLIIAPGSDLSADKTLTLTTGDADRTLTISGDTTLGGGSHSGTNTGDQTSVTGNAGTVTVADAGGDTTTWVLLGTSQTGSLAPATDAGLTYNATTNELTTTTFIGALTGTASGNLVSGGALGTPSSGTLTNCTGLPIAGLTSSTTQAVGVGSIELGHASDTTIARSGAGAITVEGVQVILSGAALGTPSSGTLTNCTGLPVAGITSSTSTALGVGSLEIGHASDTTLTRASAGVAAIEGNNILTVAGGTLTGAITLGENTSIALDPAGSADGKYSGITVAATGGATIAFGDLITLDKDDSRWELVDISVAAAATGDARGLLGMAVTSSTDGGALTVLLNGTIRADANFPALTIGAPVYASTTGDVVVTQPTTTDHVIRIVGYGLTADEMYFNPGTVWTTHT